MHTVITTQTNHIRRLFCALLVYCVFTFFCLLMHIQMAALAEEVGYSSRACVATEGNLLKDLCIIMQGHATFKRGGECLMEKVGPGAFWGDLALIQGPRLCQVTRQSCGLVDCRCHENCS
jgi:hypothetical protein